MRLAALAALLLASCTSAPEVLNAAPAAGMPSLQRPTLSAVTSDGVTVVGTIWGERNGPDKPVVMLFHQGGSNGRGEYQDIAPWLADEGFTAIAWDTRTGGSLHGSENRSAPTVPEGVPADFCDALPDLLAAMEATEDAGFDQGMVLWGSSYTGALVFHAAAERPEMTRAVIAFSPASGGPMRDCLAIERAPEVDVPMLVVQPPSEIARPTATEQRGQLEALGVSYIVPSHGVHGSSTLVDERTGHDMSLERRLVVNWLDSLRTGQ